MHAEPPTRPTLPLTVRLPIDDWVDWFAAQDDDFAHAFAARWPAPEKRTAFLPTAEADMHRLQELAPAAYAKFLARQGDALHRLRVSLVAVDHLDVLSLMILATSFGGWGEHYEPTTDPHHLTVEIVAALVATIPQEQPRTDPILGPRAMRDILAIVSSARELRNIALAVHEIDNYRHSGADDTDSVAKRIRGSLLMKRLTVRGAAYPLHSRALATRLAARYEAPLLEKTGHTIADVIAVSDAIQTIWQTAVPEAIELGGCLADAIVASRPGVPETRARELRLAVALSQVVPHLAPTVGELRELVPADTARRLEAVLATLAVNAGGHTGTFTSVLSDSPAITKPLMLFPPRDSSDAVIPDDDWRVLLVNRHALSSDLHHIVDSVLSQNFSRSWSKARAAAVDSHAVELLTRLLPGALSFDSVHVQPADGSDTFEIDGVIFYDDAIVFVEGKGAPLKPASRRGDIARYRNDLKALIGHGAEQLDRDVALLKGPPVDLCNAAGKILHRLDPAAVRRTFRVLPCFDALADIGPNLQLMHDWNLLPSRATPWIVSVPELNVIVDSLRGPAELFAYMTWREYWIADPRIMKSDEIELLVQFNHAVDIDAKMAFSKAQLDTVAIFATGQPEFDDHYDGLTGHGPASPMPRRQTTSRIRHFVDELQRRRPDGWLDASTAILCAPATIAYMVDARSGQLAERARTEGVHIAKLGDTVLGVRAFNRPRTELESALEQQIDGNVRYTWILATDPQRRNKIHLEWARLECGGPPEGP